mmetsp:Transcript_112307/g.349953  ORF Transcript_112307/g.349953 Transcript_112307/m.349953 type:complete len:418 (-) Transcript_112307:170-1423(-)
MGRLLRGALAAAAAVRCLAAAADPLGGRRGAAAAEDAADVSSLALVQEQVHLHDRRPKDRAPRDNGLRSWGFSAALGAAAPGNGTVQDSEHRNPFAKAIVVSISPDKYAAARERLEAQGVPAEPYWGYRGTDPEELQEAMRLLRKYNNTDHLHETVGNFLACLHMSPGTPPRLGAAFRELISKVLHGGPGNVQQMLDRDHHHCVPKMVAIAASHVRLWERLADGSIPSDTPDRSGAGAKDGEDDPWYLVMEEDAALCPGWRQRMATELPLIPPDADVVKLFFFGHWRKEDQLPDSPDGTPSPFLMGRDPMKGSDIAKASAYEILKGASVDNVPIAGFYAGTQAYLVKRRSARKLLSQIKGKPFQDIDMTMLTSVKHYVWRRVLSMNAPQSDEGAKHRSLMQVVPVCNREPPKDWWFR